MKLTHAARRRRVLTAALAPSRRMRICDVGANPLSVPPYAGLLEDRVAEVIGFEPNPKAFAALQAEKSDLETYFQQAVGRAGTRRFYLHTWSGLSSLYPLDAEAVAQLGRESWLKPSRIQEHEVETRPLDSIAGVPEIDLLKMDLQGAELEVLEGGAARLRDAVAVVTEVRFHRIYRDEPLFGDLDLALRQRGFKLHKFLFQKSVMTPHAHGAEVVPDRMKSQLLDGDAVYIREDDLAEALNDDQLAYLAFAADSVFDSPDLVLACVSALVARGMVDQGLPAAYIKRLRTHQRADKQT